jgi:hypothetical protein
VLTWVCALDSSSRRERLHATPLAQEDLCQHTSCTIRPQRSAAPTTCCVRARCFSLRHFRDTGKFMRVPLRPGLAPTVSLHAAHSRVARSPRDRARRRQHPERGAAAPARFTRSSGPRNPQGCRTGTPTRDRATAPRSRQIWLIATSTTLKRLRTGASRGRRPACAGSSPRW